MGSKKVATESKRDLLSSVGRRTMVKFTRTFEAGSMMGYVLAIGPDFFLLALVSSGIRYDGFTVVRFKDVGKLQALKDEGSFPAEALTRRGLRIPKDPGVEIGDIWAILKTAGDLFSVVTIYQECKDPEVCYIGSVVNVTDKHVELLEIDASACWDDQPTKHKIGNITRVDFGGDYEDALVLVGGHAPVNARVAVVPE